MVKTLLYDIETTPNLGYFWEMYETNPIKIVKERGLASIAWKWHGENRIYVKALCDMPKYKPGVVDDTALVKFAWELLDEAEAAVAHNGNQFDSKMLNGFFLQHKLPPPSSYKKIDTMLINKLVASTNKNNLDYLARLYGHGGKIETEKDLVFQCMAGSKKAWKKYKEYNKNDVKIMDGVWKDLMPYHTKHVNLFTDREIPVCPTCGSPFYKFKGWEYGKTVSAMYRKERIICSECGKQRYGKRENIKK